MPSAGCTSSTTTPTSGRFTIDASGTSREYIIKIPANYDPRRPYRLVIAFHGAQYDAASVDAGGPPTAAGAGPYYGIEPLSGGSAIFVAAQATSSGWTNANDIPYVNAMIARFESQMCIDQSRIFATGFSMGSIQTIQLGCMQANVFRAIAAMSGSLQGRSCTGTQPIAYFGSHGNMDPTINIAMGRTVRDTFVMRNHCTTTTVPGSPSGCVNYQGCDAGDPVTWCEYDDNMHRPPPYSGDAIWRFFSQF
jgi:poly(3-hydroxybutyrate) depolymerase